MGLLGIDRREKVLSGLCIEGMFQMVRFKNEMGEEPGLHLRLCVEAGLL